MSIVAVVDCNNFYASCERVFRPKLEKHPIVVLSNNDGCVIARSNEAKKLGIKMGAPAFEFKSLFNSFNVAVFSANFPLYADMSSRVMRVLADFIPRLEVYSIDEAFLSLDEFDYTDVIGFSQKIAQTVNKWTGIPVSIGIGKTKTLAKVANDIAKRNPHYRGVVSLYSDDKASSLNTDKMLHAVDVSDVWGIGRSYAGFLYSNNIYTALQLKNCDDKWVQKNLSINGLKTVHELRGIECISLDDVKVSRKSVISSKSFRQQVTDLPGMREAVASFMARAAEKLREEHLVASCIHVWIITNRYNSKEKQYNNSLSLHIPEATSYTPLLVEQAFRVLDKIYKPGYRYKKASVMLTELSPETTHQIHLFTPQKKIDEHLKLMRVVDKINSYWGREAIHFASQGLPKAGWKQNPQFKSPRYTTRWEELLQIKC